MLNMYQLWLDDLYPRAKFADALAIIEKVGHTKRMQVDRRAWIDEGKPKQTVDQDQDDMDVVGLDEPAAQEHADGTEALEEDENATRVQTASETPVSNAPARNTAEEPDDDELDALLAESEIPVQAAPKALPSQGELAADDPFADEMEALEGMEDMW